MITQFLSPYPIIKSYKKIVYMRSLQLKHYRNFSTMEDAPTPKGILKYQFTKNHILATHGGTLQFIHPVRNTIPKVRFLS